ncbi:hypothetical protein [Acinetobacter sp. TAC-1]|uniref:hypothetical protein n=1 Tax=Acinetobacter sp. TAC-1 TaxID=3027470 RepID=UPI0023AB1345|nr:hypothetical protein [Acinetobacter sp. TAC-1]WEE40983.1 hypothetical protein PYV58_07445 [Acinetobacter sp. TAC-1]
MDKFKEWFVSQYFYSNMRFVHGDALFDKDGDFFRILAVQIAWEAWQSRQSEFDSMTEALLNQTQLLAKQKVEVDEKDKRIEELESALTQIKLWESHPKNYETNFGSWGLRDFYRDLAEKALRGEHEA